MAIGMATILGADWCCRDASEALWGCCGGAVSAPLLQRLLLGAKQD